MGEDLLIQEKYHELHSVAGVQMMCVCFCRLRKWEFNNLSAPFWRWYWNQNPGASVILDGKRLALTPGQVMLIPPHTAFASGVSRPVSHLYMHFALGLDRATSPGKVFTHAPAPHERRLLERLVRALRRPGPGTELEISFLSQALVHLALAAVPLPLWEGQLPDHRIDQAICSIQAKAPEAVGNVGLANKAGITVNAFTRLFRRATGHTPHQYLIHLRIERACQLLQREPVGMDEIAERTGFYDRFHFSRTFKRYLGIGPAAFRRRAAG